jgi:hypothetical protein
MFLPISTLNETVPDNQWVWQNIYGNEFITCTPITWRIVLNNLMVKEVEWPLKRYNHCFCVYRRQALVSFKKYMPPPLPYSKVNIYPFPWLKCLISHVRWLFLSNLSEGGPVGIFKCGSRKEKYLGSVTI